jgi:hypothetical protein
VAVIVFGISIYPCRRQSKGQSLASPCQELLHAIHSLPWSQTALAKRFFLMPSLSAAPLIGGTLKRWQQSRHEGCLPNQKFGSWLEQAVAARCCCCCCSTANDWTIYAPAVGTERRAALSASNKHYRQRM